MKIKNYLLIVVLFISSAAFSQGGGAGTTINLPLTSAGTTKGSIVTRANKLYIPKNYNKNTPAGLIVVYHGTGQNPAGMQQMCQMDKYADTYNFLVVYPEGLKQVTNGGTAWRILDKRQDFLDTDYIFSNDLLDTIESIYNINLCKVFATGFSIGGFMSHVAGIEMSTRFAAIAPHSGNRLATFNTTPTHPVPALILHGDADPTVTIRQADVDSWVSFDKCAAITSSAYPTACQTDAANVTFDEYPNGTNGSVVQRYIIKGGKHTWHKDASCTIVTFFSKYCLDDLKGTTTCTSPTITANPSSTTVCSGSNATFAVSATGTNLTYQWQLDKGSGFSSLTNVAPYSNVTTATLTITGATAVLNGYKYQCVVSSGTCSPNSLPNSATLTVASAPTATISGDATVCAGTKTYPEIAFTGTAPWSVTKAINGVNQTPVSATTSPYQFTASTAGVYTVASVTDKNGCSGTSNGSITVKMISAITTSNKTEVCNGANTNYVVEFDIAGGDTATYKYKGTAGTYTTPTHFKSNILASGTAYADTLKDYYACTPLSIVTGTKTCGNNTVTCNATATISGSATVCSGTSAIISVALTGTAPYTFTYAIGGTNNSPITTSLSTYTFTSTGAGVYTLTAVTDNSGCTGTMSGSATISNNTAITTSNKTETCNGSNYIVAFDIAGGDAASYAVTGGTISSSTHFTSNPIASGTSYTYTVNDKYACTNPAVETGTKICNSGGCNATATMNGSATICSGSSAIISVALAGTPPYNFVYAIDGTNQSPITTSASTYTFSTTTAGAYTLVGITDNTPCSGTTSGSATIKINSAITTNTKTETCSGGNYVVAFDIDGGDATSYSITGGTISSNTHFTSTPIASGKAYSFTVNDKYLCASAPVVNGSKTCTSGGCNATATISGSATICSGTNSIVSIALTGTAPWSIIYALDGANQAPVTATSATYTFSASAGTYTLIGVIDGAQCTATTNGSATITDNTAITVTGKTEVCSGSNYVVGFDITGGDQASYNVTGGVGSKTSATHFTSSPIASGTQYSFTITDKYACANPTVETGTKTCVAGACNATATISGGGTVCDASITTLNIALTGVAPWNFTIDPIGINVTNQYTTPYTITSTVAGKYTVSKLTDANCTGTTSGTATVVNCVVAPPIGTVINESLLLNEIRIYPNPTDGIFNISAKNTSFKQLQITIINLVGTEIYNNLEIGIGSDFTKQIDLTHVSSGMYYIRLSDGINSKISKLSIQ
jgi:poly(3-hydroxybutyrate) depolymerase